MRLVGNAHNKLKLLAAALWSVATHRIKSKHPMAPVTNSSVTSNHFDDFFFLKSKMEMMITINNKTPKTTQGCGALSKFIGAPGGSEMMVSFTRGLVPFSVMILA